MYLTWLDSNSWLWEINGKRILLDPWLVGSLVFGNSPWFFEGVKSCPQPIPEAIDLILLSQGLPDHAHPETLRQLDPHIPVVASPNGAKVATDLGYKHVTPLPHGEVFCLDAAVEICAVPGAAIGPFLTENGYVVTDLAQGTKLYYEPHGFPDDALDQFAPIDVVITPFVDMRVPVAGAILQGYQAAKGLVKRLRPRVILPTAEGGNVEYHGLLAKVLQCEGGAEAIQQQLATAQLETRILTPQPGDRLEIQL
jgi:L-ascorbate metabolism protein UlaG (beta-lactamase superfamily)